MSTPLKFDKNITAFGEFLTRMRNEVDSQTVQMIISGRIALTDNTLYAARKIGTDTMVELCVADDARKVGRCNFDRRRLEVNMYQLVTGIRLLAGEAENVEECEFKPLKGTMLNGELEIKQGTKIIISALSLQTFANTDPANPGFYRLDVPFFIPPQTEFVPTIKLSKQQAANTCVRIELHGVVTRSR